MTVRPRIGATGVPGLGSGPGGRQIAGMIARVLVVDDEPLARERVSGLVRGVAPEAEIREVGDGDAAVEVIRAWAPEAVILDIQMPGRSGFQVIEAVGPGRMPPTIFATAHDDHAVRAFDVAAVDYLLKPFDEERFQAAWRRLAGVLATGALMTEGRRIAALIEAAGQPTGAESRVPRAEPRKFVDRVVIKKDQRIIMVPLAEVFLVESSGNYVVLHTGREKHTLRESLASIESRLDPARFVRIHRRFIVDLNAMKELQPWFGGDQIMILKDGSKLRVSRSHREVLARRIAGEA